MKSGRNRTLTIGFACLCLAWFGLISFFSSQSASVSSGVSDRVAWFLIELLEPGAHPEDPFLSHEDEQTPLPTVNEEPSTDPSEIIPVFSAVESDESTQIIALKAQTQTRPHTKDKSLEKKRVFPVPHKTYWGIEPKLFSIQLRKAAHFALFFILGVLLFAFFRSLFERLCAWVPLLATVFAFLFACIDEFHQYFVPDREVQFSDILLDTVGAFFGILLLFLITLTVSFLRKRRQRHNFSEL